MSFLSENGLLSDKQHGFLSKKSTLTNLLATVNMWIKARSNNKNVHVIYTDFAKAFDKVSHMLLLFKLKELGITNTVLQWIEAFLSNRTQQVVVNGEF